MTTSAPTIRRPALLAALAAAVTAAMAAACIALIGFAGAHTPPEGAPGGLASTR